MYIHTQPGLGTKLASASRSHVFPIFVGFGFGFDFAAFKIAGFGFGFATF